MPTLTPNPPLLPPAVPAPDIPRIGGDSSLGVLREGYLFGTHRFERSGTDVFQTRLSLRNVLVAYGEEAVRVFYEPGRTTRRRALPVTALTLLQDFGSAFTLDGEDHHHRKAMLLSVMTPASIAGMADLFAAEVLTRVERWSREEHVVLLDEMHEALTAAVFRWSGVVLTEAGLARRTHELAAMIDGAGSFGPRNLRGQLQRRHSERWARWVVEQVRSGRLPVAEGEPLDVLARHRDRDGELLPVDVAAVELLNLLRPTVAVARFVMFAALALHEHPHLRDAVAQDDQQLEWFVQEVRRTTPFFPFVGGRVLEDFDWRGNRIPEGTWLLVDLYATNHDRRTWGDPETFRPERFRDWDGSPFSFVPQGGGDHATGHRCAGEWMTIALVRQAVRLLTTAVHYDVPPQDLHVDLSRFPATPASRFVISSVSRAV